MTLPPADLLTSWRLSAPDHVARTAQADVWRVTRANGTLAALKVYHADAQADEAPGRALLTAWAGHVGPAIFAQADAALLLEWLPGPDLIACPDLEATGILAALLPRMHGIATPAGLTPLRTRFDALLQQTDMPEVAAHARDLALILIDRQEDLTPLHGDLHHENVRMGRDGWRVFDPKGLIGDRAYDVSNVFCNPLGSDARFDPSRITRLAQCFAAALDVPPLRILDWAMAHAALSATWSGYDTPDGQERLQVAETIRRLRRP